MILSRVGTRTSRIVIGSNRRFDRAGFLVPSATARAAAVIPIMMGVILAFGVDRKSRFAGLLMITTVQAVSIWNVGIKTAAAQNMVAVGFVQKMLGHDITWLSWLIAAAPFSILMSIGLYFIMMFMMPPEAKEIPGGQDTVKKSLRPAWPDDRKRDSPPGRFADPAVLLVHRRHIAPVRQLDHHHGRRRLAVPARHRRHGLEEGNALIPWGTIVLFGVGISLGTALLQTQAAQWLANLIVDWFGLNHLAALTILAVMAAF